MKKIYFILCATVISFNSFAQTFPNAGMETWRTNTTGISPVVTIHAPISWYGFDSLIIADGESFGAFIHAGTNFHAQLFQEDTIIHSGASSAKVVTVKQDVLGIIAGVLSNASISVNALAVIGGASLASATSFNGGTAVSHRVDTVSAWVEYLPGVDSLGAPAPDTGLLTVQAISYISGSDSVVGTGVIQILPADSFKQIAAVIVYTDMVDPVDTIRITFSSSNGGRSRALNNSTLYVDDVAMSWTDEAVKGVSLNNSLVTVYPNPASTSIFFNGPKNEQLTAVLYSISGQAVATKSFSGNDAITVATLPSGLYFYALYDKSGNAVQRGKVAVNR